MLRIKHTSGTLVHFTPVVEKRAAVVLVRTGGSEMAFALACRLLRVVWDQGNTRGGSRQKKCLRDHEKNIAIHARRKLRSSVMKSFNGS